MMANHVAAFLVTIETDRALPACFQLSEQAKAKIASELGSVAVRLRIPGQTTLVEFVPQGDRQ